MILFQPITPNDKELITSYILPSGQQDCDLSFANLCSWHFMSESAFAVVDNRLILRFTNEDGQHEYFMPIGDGNLIPIVDKLSEQADAEK